MPETKVLSQAVIDETRDAISEARVAIRRSRQVLAQMRQRGDGSAEELPPGANTGAKPADRAR